MDIAKVTWIGDRERREFATIVARLASENNAHFLTWSESLECSRLSSIVVLAQSRPGEFEATTLNRLRDGNPNSKWIRLLGAWCSGAGRALQAQSGIASVDAHLITSDVVRRSSMLETIKDISERDVSTEIDVIEGNAGPLVAVYGRSASYSRGLSDAVAAVGTRRVEMRLEMDTPVTGVDVVLWELPADADQQRAELNALRRRHPQARVLAIGTFPREFEIRELNECDVDVLAQPFHLADLLAVLQRRDELRMVSAA